MTRALAPRRTCAWCTGPIPDTARADAETCSRACRQARHRFRVAPAAAAAAQPLRFAYADPPYPGLSRRYYKEQPTFGGEVDHKALIERLAAEYPDGWALSTSAAALPMVLKLCPDGVRVAIWVKGSRRGVSWRARNAYEPVIIWGGRPRKLGPREELDDVLIWGGRQHSHPGALVGMKSAAFCEWMFRQLGALAGDVLDDLFPGSGAVMRAWESYGGSASSAPGPELRLPIADQITAPPVARRRTTVSRLAEASRSADTRLRGLPDAPAEPPEPEPDPDPDQQLPLFAAKG